MTLRFRPYKDADADAIVSWIGDERAFRKWCADRYPAYPITAEDVRAHYRAFTQNDGFFPMTAFDETGPVGHMILRFTDEKKSVVRFGFVIVDPQKRGMGHGRKMLSLATLFAFELLKADQITLGVFENNEAAYRCYRAAGFAELPPETSRVYRFLDEDWRCREMALLRPRQTEEK